LTLEEIQIHVPHVSILNIRERAKIRGASYTRQKSRNVNRRYWREAEDEIVLRGTEDKLPKHIILEQLPGRTLTAVESRLKALKVVDSANCPIRGSQQRWTREEEETLVKLYKSDKPIAEIGNLLGRAGRSIRAKLNVLSQRHVQVKPGDREAE